MSPRRAGAAGGLAGLVFTVGGVASAFLIDLPASFARFGVEPTATAALIHTGLRFAIGYAAILAYLGLRRDPGLDRTAAIRAAGLVWFLAYVPGSAVLHELGVLSAGQLAFAIAWGLGESFVATLAGAVVASGGAGTGRPIEPLE